MKPILALWIPLMILLAPMDAAAAVADLKPASGDFLIPNFRFRSGEVLPELRIHYRTFGTLARDASGRVRNAVLLLHGTGGSGESLLTEQFAGALFGPGQLLDAGRYFLILPDAIGHGGSSKPSDGLRARFPRYGYEDIVEVQHRLVTERLGVDHLRLVLGTSMGGMQTWMWGEEYPRFMDALMPLACLPVEIAGRNRMQRRMILDAIRTDPSWNGGDYEAQPHGLVSAIHIMIIQGSSPLQMQEEAPTREAADRLLAELVGARLARTDANDLLYQWDASREYNPAPGLGRIEAPLVAINFADDEINPPELGILEREVRRVKRGRWVLIPVSDETRGHGTHSLPKVWGHHLAALLRETEP